MQSLQIKGDWYVPKSNEKWRMVTKSKSKNNHFMYLIHIFSFYKEKDGTMVGWVGVNRKQKNKRDNVVYRCEKEIFLFMEIWSRTNRNSILLLSFSIFSHSPTHSPSHACLTAVIPVLPVFWFYYLFLICVWWLSDASQHCIIHTGAVALGAAQLAR
jgi:hypothetical protein